MGHRDPKSLPRGATCGASCSTPLLPKLFETQERHITCALSRIVLPPFWKHL
jgi:hypothetical protein